MFNKYFVKINDSKKPSPTEFKEIQRNDHLKRKIETLVDVSLQYNIKNKELSHRFPTCPMIHPI